MIRNLAIIAHVDHGKTTLVDQMLRQAGAFRANQQVEERVMDSNPLERERGITILAKNTAVRWHGTKINIVDTPGHSDFGGEVERILRMVDGVLILVDAAEGPMPQTRFVTRKALALGLRPIVAINKIDRSDAEPLRVHDEVLGLFIDLEATHEQLDAPFLYTSSRFGTATSDLKQPSTDLTPLFQTILDYVPEPKGDPEEPFQMLVSTLDFSSFIGRIAIGRIERGRVRVGDQVALLPLGEPGLVIGDEQIERNRVTRLYTFDGLNRVEVEQVDAGDIVALSGFETIEIGKTFTSTERLERMEGIAVEEPTISVDFIVNNGPFAGRDGKFVTSRQLRDRLFRELERNVALRVEETDTPDTHTVSGRGELHLGHPDGDDAAGRIRVPGLPAPGHHQARPRRRAAGAVRGADDRRGRGVHGRRHGEAGAPADRDDRDEEPGAGHGPHELPDPGSRAVRLPLGVPDRYPGHRDHAPPVPGLRAVGRPAGGTEARGADRRPRGPVVAFALGNLQERAQMFVAPGDLVYEGMIAGENSRPGDMDVNVTKEKKLSNMRTTATDDNVILEPPRQITLEYALEYIEEDELIEVTPKTIRLRKRVLPANDRKKAARAARVADAS